jgi:hypothetical protein
MFSASAGAIFDVIEAVGRAVFRRSSAVSPMFRTAGRTGNSLSNGMYGMYRNALQGSMYFTVPITAFAFASSDRGEKVSSGVGAGAASIIPAAFGAFVGGLPGAVVGSYLGSDLTDRLVKGGLQFIHDLPQRVARLEMGGNYQDSQMALTMRQRASQEMSTSLLNARQYLGSEGRLMHV